MLASFINQIRQHFADILDANGFSKTSERVVPGYFGDCVIEFGSNTLRLRFAKSRGEPIVEVAAITSSEWYDLQLVLEFVKGESGSGPIADLHGLSDGLRTYLREVERTFASTLRVNDLRQFERARSKQVLREVFPKI